MNKCEYKLACKYYLLKGLYCLTFNACPKIELCWMIRKLKLCLLWGFVVCIGFFKRAVSKIFKIKSVERSFFPTNIHDE